MCRSYLISWYRFWNHPLQCCLLIVLIIRRIKSSCIRNSLRIWLGRRNTILDRSSLLLICSEITMSSLWLWNRRIFVISSRWLSYMGNNISSLKSLIFCWIMLNRKRINLLCRIYCWIYSLMIKYSRPYLHLWEKTQEVHYSKQITSSMLRLMNRDTSLHLLYWYLD